MCASVERAAVVWRLLNNGLLCLHKPPDMTTGRLLTNVKIIASNGLNELKVRPVRKIVHVHSPLEKTIAVDYSDHPLVIGPRYQLEDIQLRYTNYLGSRTSGVFVLGINHGRKLANELINSKPARVYRLMGELGQATDTFYSDGKVVERSSYNHVRRVAIDKAAATIESLHQRAMFAHSGIPLQSQAAYELAVGGLQRPENYVLPVIYRMNCVSFESPFFTLEVMCINENEDFLLELVHTIGMKVHSAAKCLKVQCIRYGPFQLEHALLRRKWNVLNFSKNIEICKVLDEEDRKSERRVSPHLLQTSTPVKPSFPLREGSSSAPASQTDLSVTSEQSYLTRMNRHQERRRLKRLQSDSKSCD